VLFPLRQDKRTAGEGRGLFLFSKNCAAVGSAFVLTVGCGSLCVAATFIPCPDYGDYGRRNCLRSKESIPISRDHELSYCREVVSAIDLMADNGHTEVSNVIREEVYERPADDTVICVGRHPVPLPATAAAAATTETSTANRLRLSLQNKSSSLATLACLDSRLQPSSSTNNEHLPHRSVPTGLYIYAVGIYCVSAMR
jgi:hypothetical protein